MAQEKVQGFDDIGHFLLCLLICKDVLKSLMYNAELIETDETIKKTCTCANQSQTTNYISCGP